MVDSPFVWGAGGAQMTPEAIAAQRKVAEAMMTQGMDYTPIKSWTQGAARVAQALVGGLDARRADDAERTNAAADKELIAGWTGGAPAPALPTVVAPVAPASGVNVGPVQPAPVSAAPTAGRILSNDESSPLDPPVGVDRENAIRTVIAEAGNQPAIGQQAVASVIRNRAVDGGYGGDTPTGVVTARNQFEPWNTPAGRARMAAIDPNSPQYQAAAAAVDAAYTGDDPTNGAKQFFAPKAQAALGREAPAWGRVGGQDIADHRFFGGAGATDMSAQSRPKTAVEAVAAAMPTAAQPAGAAPFAGANPQGLLRAISSPYTSEATKKIAGILLQQQIKPTEYGFSTLPDGTVVRQNPRTGQVEPIFKSGTKPTFGVIGKNEDGKETYGFIDAGTGKVTPVEAPGSGRPEGDRGSVIGPDGKPIQIPAGVDRKTFVNEVSRAGAKAAAGEKTEVQAKAEQFGNRMETAEKNLSGIENEGLGVSGAAQSVAGSVPIIGSAMQSTKYQKFEQAKSQFITALLRQESGAAIGREEFTRYEKEFFPQPGDSAETVDQKRNARKVAIDAMKKGAGPGYKSPASAAPAGQTSSGVKWSVE